MTVSSRLAATKSFFDLPYDVRAMIYDFTFEKPPSSAILKMKFEKDYRREEWEHFECQKYQKLERKASCPLQNMSVCSQFWKEATGHFMANLTVELASDEDLNYLSKMFIADAIERIMVTSSKHESFCRISQAVLGFRNLRKLFMVLEPWAFWTDDRSKLPICYKLDKQDYDRLGLPDAFTPLLAKPELEIEFRPAGLIEGFSSGCKPTARQQELWACNVAGAQDLVCKQRTYAFSGLPTLGWLQTSRSEGQHTSNFQAEMVFVPLLPSQELGHPNTLKRKACTADIPDGTLCLRKQPRSIYY